ncbi:hypothetical protein K0M31_018682 [Melipona bicolor]|uniref:Uncharacterized protein n=1 Tax=Melipona bicolor TaxID=60889 RepID=A0AA40KRX0_9HYME|nr:hypothetical protein K0M31_018682 [Melipona bicolor]
MQHGAMFTEQIIVLLFKWRDKQVAHKREKEGPVPIQSTIHVSSTNQRDKPPNKFDLQSARSSKKSSNFQIQNGSSDQPLNEIKWARERERARESSGRKFPKCHQSRLKRNDKGKGLPSLQTQTNVVVVNRLA